MNLYVPKKIKKINNQTFKFCLFLAKKFSARHTGTTPNVLGFVTGYRSKSTTTARSTRNTTARIIVFGNGKRILSSCMLLSRFIFVDFGCCSKKEKESLRKMLYSRINTRLSYYNRQFYTYQWG